MNESIEKIILKYFQNNPKSHIKLKELSQILDFPKKKYPTFRNTIKELVNAGKLFRYNKNLYGLPDREK